MESTGDGRTWQDPRLGPRLDFLKMRGLFPGLRVNPDGVSKRLTALVYVSERPWKC